MNSLRSYRYRVVDVFTERPLEGNALAVFPDASGLDDATMRKIARELNLSETTFVYPATRADCAASVQIFTPTRELPFAGHPTIGTSFVLLDEGMVSKDSERFALEEKVDRGPGWDVEAFSTFSFTANKAQTVLRWAVMFRQSLKPRYGYSMASTSSIPPDGGNHSCERGR